MLVNPPRTAAAAFWALTFSVQCATIPPGAVLAARQEMIRKCGFEPESLDPALVESTAAGNILSDVFETL